MMHVADVTRTTGQQCCFLKGDMQHKKMGQHNAFDKGKRRAYCRSLLRHVNITQCNPDIAAMHGMQQNATLLRLCADATCLAPAKPSLQIMCIAAAATAATAAVALMITCQTFS
jgi:hypothetical protein